MLRSIRILAALSVLSAVQAKIYDTRFAGTTWDEDNWTITTTDLVQGQYQSRMSLANGYLGINLAAAGPFFEYDVPVDGDNINGWPLFDRRQTFASIAGFYDEQPTTNMTNFAWLQQYGGESVISGVPHWAGLHVQVGDDMLEASTPKHQLSNFKSSLDIRNGMMTWSYTWKPSGGSIDVEYVAFVNKLYVNQAAVQVKLTAKSNTKATVIDVLDGDCALRTNFVGKGYESKSPIIWSAVSPHGVPQVEGYIYSAMIGDKYSDTSSRKQYTVKSVIGGNSSSIGQSMTVNLKPGKAATIAKFIGGASSDAYNDPQTVAAKACQTGANNGWAKSYAAHTGEWQNIMTDDTVDDYRNPETGNLPADHNVVELAITAVTNPFHLLQNTISSNALALANNDHPIDVNSIAVGGLGSDSYAGWIFWDAEVWMAPGLVVTYPDAAKQIALYRKEKFGQAQKNIKTAYQSSQNKTGKFSSGGAVFPWVSGRWGNCTAAGPCFDYEYHINGDIGLELFNYYAVTGDTKFFEKQLFPMYDAVAKFYSELVTYNHSAGKYYLYNATDPDEYANFQTNVGYTMVLMKTHIETANMLRSRFGDSQNQTWNQIAKEIEVPIDHDANIILEYQTMNGSVQVKQADVVLVDDFLDFPNPYSLSDLYWYTGHQSLNGPGMTYAVFSIIDNRISTSGCASFTYQLYGSKPYTRGPWFQFSEQLIDNYSENGGTHPAYPFLTGIGGANRVAVFGYLGLQLMVDTLNINPSIPPQIPHLKYRTIHWQGWPIQAYSNQTHTTLTRTGKPLDGANSTYASAAIPVTIGIQDQYLSSNDTIYNLEPEGSITIKNRMISEVKTVPGNIAQCQPVESNRHFELGQFPLSAVDGSITTKWQPDRGNVSSSLRVRLPEPFVPITELRFDWAQSPPKSYEVVFSNSSDGSNAIHVSSNSNVQVSSPYVVKKAAEIVPYASNTTNVTLNKPIWSGKYATLTISGNRATEGTPDAKNGTGASVAEWAIVAGDGSSLTTRDVEVLMA